MHFFSFNTSHTKQLLLERFCGMFAPDFNIRNSDLPSLMDQRCQRVTQNAYFSLLTHTKQLLSMILCDLTARIGASFRTHRQTDGQTYVEVKKVI